MNRQIFPQSPRTRGRIHPHAAAVTDVVFAAVAVPDFAVIVVDVSVFITSTISR